MADESSHKSGQAKAKEGDDNEPKLPRSFLAMVAESLFTILPLLVLTIVLVQKGRGLQELIASPEWSFASAVLMGQTVVKLVYAISAAKKGRVKNAEFMQLIAALIIVLGLVPSLIVLSLILTTGPSPGLAKSQMVLFILGLAVFLSIGMFAHWMMAVDVFWLLEEKGKPAQETTSNA